MRGTAPRHVPQGLPWRDWCLVPRVRGEGDCCASDRGRVGTGVTRRAALHATGPGGWHAQSEGLRLHFEPRSWEWVDQNHFVCRERSLTGDHDRLISREVVVDAERGVITDQFYAERLYSKERLEALLSGVGFNNLRVHRLLAPASCRNQDLGMMAHRLLVTCEVPRRARLLSPRSAVIPSSSH